MAHKLWIAALVSVIHSTILTLDATVQQFTESPGLYYDHIGDVKLYNADLLPTYLQIADGNFEIVRNYAQLSAEFCKRLEHLFWTNYTGCSDHIDR